MPLSSVSLTLPTTLSRTTGYSPNVIQYLPPITWQQATGRLSNYYLYFEFCFLEMEFLGKNSESKEKKS